MRHILRFLKPYTRQVLLAMLLVTVSTTCNLLLPTLMSRILDLGVYQKDFPYIARVSAAMFVVALVGLACILGATQLSTFVVAHFSADLRRSVFEKVHSMSFEEFSQLGTGALVTRSTHDVGNVSWVASMLAGTVATIPVLFIGGVVLSFWKDATLSLILMAFVPFIIVVVILIGKKINPLWDISDEYIDKQNDLMRQRLRGIRVIRAFGSEAREHGRIADATHIMSDNLIRANVWTGVLTPVATFALNLAVLLIVYVGGGRMQRGTGLSAGDVFAVVQYVTLVMNGIIMAAFAIVMYPNAAISARRINQVLQVKGMADPIAEQDITLKGDIALSHVSFRYEGAAEDALQDVSLHIRAGQRVCVIGGTGSGKSTLVALLLGFHSPTHGQILFDGTPSSQLSRRSLRRNISCVLQQSAVYSGTLRENIQMGDLAATEAELSRAADIAQLSEFVSSLPDGLGHEIKQSGKNLSGGQKQRLAIARAVAKDAPIYIFDDSFSALDFLTEAKLRKALNEKAQGKTQIVITQRITSALHSDCIFVMDKGQLVDAGRHEELLGRCQVYREIYASQTGGGRL